jgi:hypothetical protein
MADAGFNISLAGRVSQLKNRGPDPEWRAAVTWRSDGPRSRATLETKKELLTTCKRGAVWPCEKKSGETSCHSRSAEQVLGISWANGNGFQSIRCLCRRELCASASRSGGVGMWRCPLSLLLPEDGGTGAVLACKGAGGSSKRHGNFCCNAVESCLTPIVSHL